ncbi:hypothetical protein AWZ03_001684 [Drosophila navojoa]|uniref:Uncharacterized protein n=1 Tax=Drosophila navojoa TaxID=7232 RepID=A0A484BTM8_DRONA|nr:hypothetical protein AWZ03_001684 [Drosophila navojoa]
MCRNGATTSSPARFELQLFIPACCHLRERNERTATVELCNERRWRLSMSMSGLPAKARERAMLNLNSISISISISISVSVSICIAIAIAIAVAVALLNAMCTRDTYPPPALKVPTHRTRLGNANYRQGNYENAVRMYSQALENIKDSPILYINRSLSYIKLSQFKRAIIDCDFVLNKLDEKNMRAWLYRAMAYKGLNDEASYDNCIRYVRKYHSKQLEFIDSFIEKMNNMQ